MSGSAPVQDSASYPFPTLRPAKDGITGLLVLLPHKDEAISYLNSFQHRAQGCSFPLVPKECTPMEIEQFLAHAEHNSLLQPDTLALIFASLALGSQHGVYDRCGGRWLRGIRELESKKGDVYSMSCFHHNDSN